MNCLTASAPWVPERWSPRWKNRGRELTPRKQDNAAATMAPPLTKDMAQFDFTQDAAHIHNWVRGMNPWPVAWFAQDGKRIKVLESRLAENPQHAAPAPCWP